MFCVGIDIGHFSIKAAEIDASGKNFRITRVDEYLLSQDPDKDTKIEIIEILREISRKYDPQNTKYILGVNETQVALRRVQFPFKERHKILKSVPFELEDQIPLNMDETIFDAKVSRYLGKHSDTLAIACPKDFVKDVLDLSKDGLIAPAIVSVKSLSLANLFEVWREAPLEEAAPMEAESEEEVDTKTYTVASDQASLYVNLGHNQSQVLLIKNGYLLDTRTIDFGGRQVAEEIAKKFNIHYLEALKELRKKGFVLLNNEGASSEQIKLSDTIKSSFESFFKQLKLTMLALQGEHNIEFQEAFVSGGLCGIKNIGALFTQNIEVATNKLKSLPLLKSIDLEKSEHNEIAALTAIGLALEGVKRPKNPAVDLLRDDFAVQGRGLEDFMNRWGTLLKTATALFVLLFVYSIIRDSMTENMAFEARSTLKKQAQKITGAKPHSATREAKQYIRKQKQKEKAQKAFKNVSTINSALDVLQEISQIRPDGKNTKFNVHHIDILGENVIIKGSASNSAAVKSFYSALKNIALNTKVNSSSSNEKVKAGWQGFLFQFKIPRTNEEEGDL